MANWSDILTTCFEHYGINPNGRDPMGQLEAARAEEMAGLGFEAKICVRCQRAYPKVLSDQAICPVCVRLTKAMEAREARRFRRRPKTGTVRISDGLGCTEAVPNWTLGFDPGGDGR